MIYTGTQVYQVIHVSKLKKKIFLPPKVNGFLHKKLNFKIFKVMNLSNLPVHVKAVASWLSKYSLLNLSNFFFNITFQTQVWSNSHRIYQFCC